MSSSGRVALSSRLAILMAAAAAACSLLAACGESPPPAASTTAADPAVSAGKQPQLPPEMVAAVAAGKTATAIGVHFALKSAPVVGQTLQADIAIVPHESFDVVRARFEPQEGVLISGGRDLEPQKNPKAEQVLSHRIVLEPQREGLFMVTAAIETESQAGTVTRIFTIPLIVSGPPASAPSVPAPASASGAASPAS